MTAFNLTNTNVGIFGQNEVKQGQAFQRMAVPEANQMEC